MKHESGGDHLAVGWQLPDGSMERPIPGYRLSPIALETNRIAAATALESEGSGAITENIFVYPNPFDEVLTIAPARHDVKLQELLILNMAGQVVYRTSSLDQEEGKYVLQLAPAGLASGIYFLKYTDTAGNTKFIRLVKN